MKTYAAAVIEPDQAKCLVGLGSRIKEINDHLPLVVSKSTDMHATIGVDRDGFYNDIVSSYSTIELETTAAGSFLYGFNTDVVMLVLDLKESDEVMGAISKLDKSPMKRRPHITIAAIKLSDLFSQSKCDDIRAFAKEGKWDYVQNMMDRAYSIMPWETHAAILNFAGKKFEAQFHFEAFNPSDLINMKEGEGIHTRMLEGKNQAALTP